MALDAAGRSTYDLCHAAAAPWQTGSVLDLGCGGGHLLARFDAAQSRSGVDLSPAQVERARRRLGPDVPIHCGRADALPLPSASVDCVVSHMALMLMEPLDAVVDELTRILRPGGGLVAVVGGPRPTDPTTQAVCTAWSAQLRTLPKHGRPTRFGDPRCHQPDTLVAALGDGFDDATVETIPMRRVGTPTQHWGWLAGMYNLWGHAEAEVSRVRAAMMALLTDLAPTGDPLSVGLSVRLLVATRSGRAPKAGRRRPDG